MKRIVFLIIAGIVSSVSLSFTVASAKNNFEQEEFTIVTKKENKKLLDPRKISIEEMKSLINRGADVNIRNKELQTPLHLLTDPAYSNSVDSEIIEKIKILIDAGANVNARAKRGETPLHGCEPGVAVPQDPRIISILIQAGANPNLKAYGDNTVLDLYEKGVDVLNERIHKYSMIKNSKMTALYQNQLQKYEEQIMTLKTECERKGIKLVSKKDVLYGTMEYEENN